MEALITDVNVKKFLVTDCTLTYGWVHFTRNGRKYSTPSSQILMIAWDDAKTKD